MNRVWLSLLRAYAQHGGCVSTQSMQARCSYPARESCLFEKEDSRE